MHVIWKVFNESGRNVIHWTLKVNIVRIAMHWKRVFRELGGSLSQNINQSGLVYSEEVERVKTELGKKVFQFSASLDWNRVWELDSRNTFNSMLKTL